ncbi:TetR-like C-terminal domain-containing protein [Weissella paramesenteroides]|uniref:TetR-like C-terminal domain-containing protein n=1 Tax=Weissella paramesenteroides TaxID=1249 RepID=UPI003F7448AB
MNQFAELILGDFPQRSVKRYTLYFLSGALLNTIIQWLKSDAQETPETMANVLIALLSEDFRAF